MAHMLRDVYATQLAETPPPLEFDEQPADVGGSCAGPSAMPTNHAPALDVPRLWRQDALEADAHAPPSTPRRLSAPVEKSSASAGRITPGSKDPKKLRRGPSTGGAAAPVGAISG
jgi:hypothetical protein